MGLNFRTGFFRLWVFSSFAWAVLAGWISFGTAYRDTRLLSDLVAIQKAYETECQIRLGTVSGEKKQLYEEAVRRGLIPRIHFVRDLWSPDPLEKQISSAPLTVEYLGKKTEFPPGTKPSEIWQSYRPQIKEKMMREYLVACAWMVLPPLGAFILGVVIAWILRGFAQAERNV
jgi:hypothetical protein